MSGPAPKPTALKILQGNPGKTKLRNQLVIDPITKEFPPPAYLNKIAKDYWKNYIGQLKFCGILTKLDLHALEMTAFWYGEFRTAQRQYKRRPVIKLKDRNGRVVNEMRNPAHGAMTTATDKFNMYAQQLGLSPSARTRIVVGDEKKKEQENTLARRLFG